jgi:hypothetical protein
VVHEWLQQRKPCSLALQNSDAAKVSQQEVLALAAVHALCTGLSLDEALPATRALIARNTTAQPAAASEEVKAGPKLAQLLRVLQDCSSVPRQLPAAAAAQHALARAVKLEAAQGAAALRRRLLELGDTDCSVKDVQMLFGMLSKCSVVPLDVLTALVSTAVSSPPVRQQVTPELLLLFLQQVKAVQLVSKATDTNRGINLDLERAQILQPILSLFVDVCDAGKGEQQHGLEIMETCQLLKVVPIALVLRLAAPCSWFRPDRFSSLGAVRTILCAFGNLGAGSHDKELQEHIPWPTLFICRVIAHAATLDVEGADRACCRSICRALCYLNLPGPDMWALFKRLFVRGRPAAGGSSISMHELWQAWDWAVINGFHPELRTLLHEEEWRQLEAARTAALDSTSRQPTTKGQDDMVQVLKRIQEKHPTKIVFVSKSEARLDWPEDYQYLKLPRCLLWSVDALVRRADGRWFVWEYDGPTHHVGPYGSLSGSSLWRNGDLTASGYEVCMVYAELWDGWHDQKKEAFMAAAMGIAA